ncbi:MAG: hypothetical protein ACM3NW_06465 [Syntrophomonadaceae bacterium]
MSGDFGPAAEAERASASEDGRLLFRDVSFAVSAGTVLALLGQRTAAAALIQSLAGDRRLTQGRMTVLGLDPRRRWRLRGRRAFRSQGSPLSPLRSSPDLLLLDEPPAPPEAFRAWLRERTAAGMATVVATRDAALATALADRAAVFSRGRLVSEGTIPDLIPCFRRLRFVNRLTETRTAFGTELDEFDALRVRVRGWGIEAVVADYDEAAFERLRRVDGVTDAESETMTLAEIVEACAEGA